MYFEESFAFIQASSQVKSSEFYKILKNLSKAVWLSGLSSFL